MNLILIDPNEIHLDRVVLTDRRCQHILKILRAEAGDTLKIGIINSHIGTGLIENLSPKAVTLKINATTPPPPKVPTRLILALPRPIMLKRVLSQAASLGVEHIYLIKANRVEKSYYSASIMAEAALNEALRLGLEQAMDCLLPRITVHTRFRPFIEDVLPPLLSEDTVSLIAHPEPPAFLDPGLLPTPNTPVAVAIGPEGGWVDYEIQRFHELGFISFSLGPRILRVDTAVPAILSQLDLLRHLKTGVQQ
ncbi:MAG: 16S rRNA (uracil(1498)-N(3))-methyltransferase [Proteobacteria bacterium]|nr:16S rRNA (uracil(1498)-N(3))-methyltransferase [Pseudomonadota bacterium]MBU1688614.1 16S rRNA (uracil(1498)-N(3))-methyltransferase [Pseudomonadota bacterium]